jgi:NDP-sugar pyrophosphorylase family protein
VEEFLGVLFCGGKGTRLGEITTYISKPLIPVYDRPVLKFGLSLLEQSRYISEIIILSNVDNDKVLRSLGHKTIIQDDNLVHDMISGWQYLKEVTGTKKHGVLMPGDNISDVNVDLLLDIFMRKKADFVFSLYELYDRHKLAQMGCYDPDSKNGYYKHINPPSNLGIIAPFIIHRKIRETNSKRIIDQCKVETHRHDGYWFDIGDLDSIIEASQFIRTLHDEHFVMFM